MGEKLASYYEKVNKIGGLKAQMRMAVITKLPIQKARALPDTHDNIQLFEKAFNEIEKEFK